MTADIFKRFIRRKASLIGGIILLLFLLMALIGPFLCTQDPNAQDIANKYALPAGSTCWARITWAGIP